MKVVILLVVGSVYAQSTSPDGEAPPNWVRTRVYAHVGPMELGPEDCELVANKKSLLSVPVHPGGAQEVRDVQKLPGGRVVRLASTDKNKISWWVSRVVAEQTCWWSEQAAGWLCEVKDIEFWERRGSIAYDPWPAFSEVYILDLVVYNTCRFGAADTDDLARALRRMGRRDRGHALAILYGQMWFKEEKTGEPVRLSQRVLQKCRRWGGKACFEVAAAVHE